VMPAAVAAGLRMAGFEIFLRIAISIYERISLANRAAEGASGANLR